MLSTTTSHQWSLLRSLDSRGLLVVMVGNDATFVLILCHMIGKRPIRQAVQGIVGLLLFLMGEACQLSSRIPVDYRYIKPWQLDPSKWIIWSYPNWYDQRLQEYPTKGFVSHKETKKQLNDQISLFRESDYSASDIIEQSLASLEEIGDRLNEISNKLQTAIQGKIDLFKKKLREFHGEVDIVLAEIKLLWCCPRLISVLPHFWIMYLAYYFFSSSGCLNKEEIQRVLQGIARKYHTLTQSKDPSIVCLPFHQPLRIPPINIPAPV